MTFNILADCLAGGKIKDFGLDSYILAFADRLKLLKSYISYCLPDIICFQVLTTLTSNHDIFVISR
jgi:mRNA deadenylase 3'-5' endonuclease subunit Ccr4